MNKNSEFNEYIKLLLKLILFLFLSWMKVYEMGNVEREILIQGK